MVLRKLFARVLVACLVLGIWTTSAISQTRPRTMEPAGDVNEISCSPDDFALAPTLVAEAKPAWEVKAKPAIDLTPAIGSSNANFLNFQPALLAAIDERLGARYRWGAQGPDRFDCSGFVWSIFNASGINFERGSARTLFARFAPAAPDEQFKFGTIVFFSGLTHVGVVADEHGFYHASRRQGVIYSPFNEYWLKRIDGFRRVPLPTTITD
jgi:cell wall-associated NlpC family hydrolase